MPKFVTILFLLCSYIVAGQSSYKRGDPIMNIQFHYTYTQPQGDMALRFGTFHNLGFGGLFKLSTNWVFAADVSYQFGNKVKDLDFLYNLTNSSGNIMTNSGTDASYNVGMRGFSSFGKVGRVFPLGLKNRNSGIMVMLGGGIYYHKINISTTRNDIPTLTEDLKKGYDKLSMGPAATQFLGYYYHSHNRFYNFYIGVDFVEAYTQSVRKYNYDTMMPDTDKRWDMTIGARIGWMIPIYLKAKTSNNEYEFK